MIDLPLMHILNSNRSSKIVTCGNCLYSNALGIFYDASKYCIECLSDHASCPECGSGYHAITIV